MASLKTFDSPVEKKRIDFATMGEYINYLELKVEYQSMKQKMEKIKAKLKGTTQTDENPAEETGQVGGQEEEEEEENAADVTEVEEDESFSFLKGHQDAKNPGKLEIGNQRYLSVKTGKIENGFVYNYFCAQRKAYKGGKVCRATLTVETNEDGSDPWPLVKTGLPPWGGWVVSHIWETFLKKFFSWRPFLISTHVK